ncbi:MAG: ABC transporter permease [Clostridia bacterium]|nr:ABC transporter permease [Clostridia bacterium]
MDLITSILNSLPGAVAQGLIWGIMAIGLYITFKILNVSDLTVDGSLCTGGAVCVVMLTSGYGMVESLICSVLAGMLCGLATGIFHTVMGIPAILAGILTQLALYSVNLKILGKANQAINASKYDLLVTIRNVKNVPLFENSILISAIAVLLIVVLLYWFFGTSLGCSLRATGSNLNMSRAQGINTKITTVLGLMVSNGLVALSGAFLAQFNGYADVSMGRGAIVTGLAAIIIGGAVFGKISSNFGFRLITAALGGVIYWIVYQVIICIGLDADLLKLLSALVVAVFLAVPYLKSEYFSKSKVRKAGAHNA